MDCAPATRLWPHVELDGKLCLAPADSRVNSRDPLAVVRSVLRSPVTLVRENAAGQNREDYQIDFTAYWARGSSRQIETLLYPEPPSRTVAALLERRRRLIAENVEEGLHWLRHLLGRDADVDAQSAAFVWLDHLPDPQNYPASATELRDLVARESRDGLNILDQVITVDAQVSYVVMAGEATDGPLSQRWLFKTNPKNSSPGGKP